MNECRWRQKAVLLDPSLEGKKVTYMCSLSFPQKKERCATQTQTKICCPSDELVNLWWQYDSRVTAKENIMITVVWRSCDNMRKRQHTRALYLKKLSVKGRKMRDLLSSVVSFKCRSLRILIIRSVPPSSTWKGLQSESGEYPHWR